MYLGTAATAFQVTRLTEASFIVSTPTRARRLVDTTVDQTDRSTLPQIEDRRLGHPTSDLANQTARCG
jgi:hypothetical protein